MDSKRILIICRQGYTHTIAKLGLAMAVPWEILVANSAEDGLTLAEATQPDVILLDVDGMLDIGTRTLLSQLQGNPSVQQIPVIAIAAESDRSADQRQFRQLGVKAVISQWFDPGMLAARISEILGW